MKCIRNERGIALVMALIISLIALTAVSALIYLVTLGTSVSGFQKRYQTAQEAAKGGLELATSDIISNAIGSSSLSTTTADLKTTYSFVSLNFPVNNTCLQQKLLTTTMTLTTNNWTNCSAASISLDPKQSPDITFTLSGPSAAQNFNVFVKIVDVIAGNSDKSNLKLEGLGVVESGSISVPHVPYTYRMEVQAERASNPDERSNLSVVFAY